jgi:triphosphoribosyl-dephospho-CoA synthase
MLLKRDGEPMLDAGLCGQLACIWEATARKAGNVHRGRDFDDATYPDFLLSAAAIAPVLTTACQQSVGDTVLQGVCATRAVVRTNTNLGILLLLAPLAAVPAGQPLRSGVGRILAALTVADAERVYEAIRLAAPGGLGRVDEQDVSATPTQTLREVMALAAGRDLIARQYANGFVEVFEDGEPALLEGLRQTHSLEGAILFAQLTLLAKHPDSLIVRKRGIAVAQEASRRAADVLATGWSAFTAFDGWLRAEGRQRNPGTTADLLTACLFILLRESTIRLPLEYPWPAGFLS